MGFHRLDHVLEQHTERAAMVGAELEAVFAAAGAVDRPPGRRPPVGEGRAPDGLLGAAARLLGRPRAPSTDGELIYAIGDVHGCYGLLEDLLSAIAHDYVRRADGRRPRLVFCGDYVDRGPESARVVEAVLWLRKRRDIQVHALKGNHEQAMLAFIEDPEAGWPWLRYGGAQTLASYGVRLPDDPKDGSRAARDLRAALPRRHLTFLYGLELIVQIGDYAFVHAGVRAGQRLDRQREEDLLWIRDGFLDRRGRFEKMIVHGHTWRDDQPQVMANRIGIDTGAYSTGVLTALRLDGTEVAILQARATDD